ncbi:unnamed protein product [Rhizophagus irregularis]|nr:unnamed protein product [Rhizophagus irregularis]
MNSDQDKLHNYLKWTRKIIVFIVLWLSTTQPSGTNFDKESYIYLKNKVDAENRRLYKKLRILWEEIINTYKENKENHNGVDVKKGKYSKDSSVAPLVETTEIVNSGDESEIYSNINDNEYKDDLDVEFSVYPTEDSPMETWILPSGKSVVDVISGHSSLHKSHPSYMGIIRLGTKIQQPEWIGSDDWDIYKKALNFPRIH